MNAPLLLSILIALVCAELAYSHRSKSLAEEKVGEMSNKIKAALQEDADARSLLYRLKYPQEKMRKILKSTLTPNPRAVLDKTWRGLKRKPKAAREY